MANEQNLMPIEEVNSRRTREQHSADSRKGGLASAAAKRQRKTLRETMLKILETPLDEIECIAKKAKENGIIADGIDTMTAINLSLVVKAMSGDVQALKEVRAWIGEDKQNVSVEIADNGLLAALTGQLPKSEDSDVES